MINHSPWYLNCFHYIVCACSYSLNLIFKQVEAGKHLEAFSMQLVILAIWKQALHICHTQAASAIDGSPTQKTKDHANLDIQKHVDSASPQCQEDICSKIERDFLQEFGNAEELAKFVEPGMLVKYFYHLILNTFLLVHYIFCTIRLEIGACSYRK